LRRWLALVGPGLLASLAGDDAGGLATTSAIGAQFGYDLLWALLALTVCLAVVQEMAARLGAATGRGLLDLVRERYCIGWALLAISAILLANAGIMVTEFAGIGAAGELLGTPRAFAILLSAGLIWYLVLYGDYRAVERVFLVMTLVFAAYPVAAVLAGPDWSAVGRGLLLPRLPGPGEWVLLVALIGTTITPYQQLFQQSAVVEKGVARQHYLPERLDAYLGAVLGNLIWGFVMVASAAALHSTARLDSAADAARALRPLAGEYARTLFGVGLFGASMLAAAVLPLSTAYSISEALGFEKGVSRSFREAPIFLGIFTFLIAVGGLVAMIPGLPLISVLLVTQVINGLLLPVVLVSVLRLVNKTELMGAHANGPVYNAASWLTVTVVSALSLLFIATRLFPGLFG
jgi:Mn2+/Fe2+ NRAMP family transporter